MVKLDAETVAQLRLVTRPPCHDVHDTRPDMDGLEDETFAGVMDFELPLRKSSKRRFRRLWSV